jgi:hypothetical protein
MSLSQKPIIFPSLSGNRGGLVAATVEQIQKGTGGQPGSRQGQSWAKAHDHASHQRGRHKLVTELLAPRRRSGAPRSWTAITFQPAAAASSFTAATMSPSVSLP